MNTMVRPAPSRSRRIHRRFAVIAMTLLFAGLLAADFLLAPRDDLYAGAARLGLSLFTVVTLIYMVTRSPFWFGANAPDRVQDEREIRLRDRAYFHAYVVFATGAVIAAFYLGQIGPDFGLWLPETTDQWWTISWVILVAALLLPPAILAWMTPDPPQDE